jgi:pimeloyl-ACP methyl ester carboxylesterase
MAQLAEREGQTPIAQRLLPLLLSDDTLQGRPSVVERVQGMITRCSVPGIAGDLRALASRPDSTLTLERITCPTLLLVGEEDAITPPSDSEMMADLLPDVRLSIIPSAGHLPNMENPDTFNFSFLSFLESL